MDADEPMPKKARTTQSQYDDDDDMDLDPELAKELEDAFMEAPSFHDQEDRL